MAKKQKPSEFYEGRHRAPAPPPEIQQIIDAFNINPGIPFPKLKVKPNHKKPLVMRRSYRRVRR